MVKRREREGGQKGSSFTPSMFGPPFPPNSFSCSTHLYTPILSAPNTLLRFVYHHLQTSYQHGPVISICLHTLPQAHYIQYYVHLFPALFFPNPLLPSLPSPSIPQKCLYLCSTTPSLPSFSLNYPSLTVSPLPSIPLLHPSLYHTVRTYIFQVLLSSFLCKHTYRLFTGKYWKNTTIRSYFLFISILFIHFNFSVALRLYSSC